MTVITLLDSRESLKAAQRNLYIARSGGFNSYIPDAERAVCFYLDRVWEAQERLPSPISSTNLGGDK